MSDQVSNLITGSLVAGAAAAKHSNPFLDHAISEGEFDEDCPVRTGIFRYVGYAVIEEYHQRGWMVVADVGPVHGHYSVLMWRCECPKIDNN